MPSKVTVLMSVYNGEKYLKPAIESILNQTFKDFELLIINDGSTDKSVNIIQSYTDRRIRLISNETNRGLIYSLNLGFDLATGEYIARMDCDDISLPQRLKLQVDFMDRNIHIGVCGSYIKKFGARNGVSRYYTKSKDIKAEFLFNTSLAHPAVIIRKKIINTNNLRFDPNFIHAEDFDFWTRLIDYTDFANLPKVLLRYRVHDFNISTVYSDIQRSNNGRVKQRQLLKLGLNPTNHDLFLHQSLHPTAGQSGINFLDQEEIWLKQILSANRKSRVYDQLAMQKIIARRWLQLNYADHQTGVSLKKFWGSSLHGSFIVLDKTNLLKLLIKNLLN